MDTNLGYGQGCTGTAASAAAMAEFHRCNRAHIDEQISHGVVLKRTNSHGDLWMIYSVDGGLELRRNLHGLTAAKREAKKMGWKLVGWRHGSGTIHTFA